MASDTRRDGRYAHRYNLNGTTDSICKECFSTIATAIWEADLERAERTHVCESRAQGQFRKLPKPEPRSTLLSWRASL
jgi:hypothetical protein